jgi:anti-sigma factor RsiW
MHVVLREHLEGYLAGNLHEAARQEVEAHLAGCPECREQSHAMLSSSRELRLLRPVPDLELEPTAGFYARVMDRVDREREVPFWSLLVDPIFGRRLVFASLVLLAVLGGYFAAFQPPVSYPSQHRPEALLADQDAAPFPTPRFGADLQRNRNAILATLASNPGQ